MGGGEGEQPHLELTSRSGRSARPVLRAGASTSAATPEAGPRDNLPGERGCSLAEEAALAVRDRALEVRAVSRTRIPLAAAIPRRICGFEAGTATSKPATLALVRSRSRAGPGRGRHLRGGLRSAVRTRDRRGRVSEVRSAPARMARGSSSISPGTDCACRRTRTSRSFARARALSKLRRSQHAEVGGREGRAEWAGTGGTAEIATERSASKPRRDRAGLPASGP